MNPILIEPEPMKLLLRPCSTLAAALVLAMGLPPLAGAQGEKRAVDKNVKQTSPNSGEMVGAAVKSPTASLEFLAPEELQKEGGRRKAELEKAAKVIEGLDGEIKGLKEKMEPLNKKPPKDLTRTELDELFKYKLELQGFGKIRTKKESELADKQAQLQEATMELTKRNLELDLELLKSLAPKPAPKASK
jgi:uncharacterized protein HemX